MVPMRYWPGAPMLKRPVLYATATERPVMMSGVARKSILPMLVGLKPKVERAGGVAARGEYAEEHEAYAVPGAGAGDVGARGADYEHYDAADGEADDDGEYGGEHGARAVLAVEVRKTFSHAVASFPWRLAPAM